MEDSSYDSDFDSLFDEDMSTPSISEAAASASVYPLVVSAIACRHAPSITGLFFDSALRIPAELERSLWNECRQRYFRVGSTNQIMLFERASSQAEQINHAPAATSSLNQSRLPPFLSVLLDTLSPLLLPILPLAIHNLLFPSASGTNTYARQVILNQYFPGEGITPHVDLLSRYGDGIIGVSLGGGTVMDFALASTSTTTSDIQESGRKEEDTGTAKVGEGRIEHHVYLPAGSVIVMTRDARYKWTHGIAKRQFDVVTDEEGNPETVAREERISITFRWLLPGADVVGE